MSLRSHPSCLLPLRPRECLLPSVCTVRVKRTLWGGGGDGAAADLHFLPSHVGRTGREINMETTEAGISSYCVSPQGEGDEEGTDRPLPHSASLLRAAPHSAPGGNGGITEAALLVRCHPGPTGRLGEGGSGRWACLISRLRWLRCSGTFQNHLVGVPQPQVLSITWELHHLFSQLNQVAAGGD